MLLRRSSNQWREVVVLLLLAATLAESKRETGVRPKPSKPKRQILINLLNEGQSQGIDDGKMMERAQRLAGALAIQTVSFEPGRQNDSAFPLLHDYLLNSYPKLHAVSWVKREVVNNFSLLYTVTGSLPNQPTPYMLAAHLDVVPATPQGWEAPPFGDQLVNGTFIYGRGALDDKGAAMSILEALEHLAKEGKQPKRSFYITFGHDEEVGGGVGGQQEISKLLRSRGVTKFDFVVDEGFTVTSGLLPGPSKPVALVGVSEKGMAMLELSVTGKPGHSSMPPWESTAGILSAALAKVEQNKHPSILSVAGVTQETFQALAPFSTADMQSLYSNVALNAATLTSRLEKSPVTNAFVRTTTAITIVAAGEKENVIPAFARAVVNHRIHPANTVQQVIDYDVKIINDSRVQVKVIRSHEGHPIAPHGPEDVPYQVLSASINQTFGDVIIAPGVMIANTDMKWYLDFSPSIFRFFPVEMNLADTQRLHGLNERISVQGFQRAADFYLRLMRNADRVAHLPPV